MTPLGTSSVAIRVNRVMVSQSVRETIKTVFEGNKIRQLWKDMHQFIKCML